MLSENRDANAARQFFKKVMISPHKQSPCVITVDKNPAYPIAVQLRQQKYLNNIIEQDHRFIKKGIKSMLGFKSLSTIEKQLAVSKPFI
ncbi:DDE-type integrase/transposase/recombinase [Paenibacillus baimaensis]|uniref:DDE-type integrase/transposase/recombinase n=1 Tax=Paenibacillus baimaensis TaxID=2982185 RepID=UPI0038CD6504